MNKTRLCVGLAFAMVSAGLRAEDKPVVTPPEQALLLGQWHFDADKSDNISEKMRARREASGHQGYGGRGGGAGGGGEPGGGSGGGRGGGGRGGGGMGGGHHGGMGGMGGGDSQGQWEARHALMEDIADPAKVMTIVWADAELTLTADDGRIRRVRPDGSSVKGEGGLERKAHWEGGHLIVESKVGSSKLTETWSLAAAEPKLHVTTRLEDPRGEPLVVQIAYDSVVSP